LQGEVAYPATSNGNSVNARNFFFDAKLMIRPHDAQCAALDIFHKAIGQNKPDTVDPWEPRYRKRQPRILAATHIG